MYADRVEAASKRSVKDRLNGNSDGDSARRRQITGKRQREDDKWEHDLFEDDEPKFSNRRIGASDLRLKLQKKSIQRATQNVRGSLPGGVRDLREKLSGTIYSQAMDTDPPKPKPASEVGRPARKSVIAEAPVASEKKAAASSVSKKKNQKVESVDSFLQSLGLEKYSISFQAEEVDMTALLHMTDEDLKAMGIPMGPRKKILLALESKV
ncbi:uncharacterized protein [Coffea arabica]|uniref:SAM domain-containing protein n=1 Tax=Coffea arabica TaxID=13443 RepID=A0ABM4VFV2_COFAR